MKTVKVDKGFTAGNRYVEVRYMPDYHDEVDIDEPHSSPLTQAPRVSLLSDNKSAGYSGGVRSGVRYNHQLTPFPRRLGMIPGRVNDRRIRDLFQPQKLSLCSISHRPR